MRTKSTVTAITAALAVGAGVGYIGGAAGSPQSASAQSPPATKVASKTSKMTGHGGSMMTRMMDTEHAKAMRDPAVRQMHAAMAREHASMMRDPAMRRLEDQAMRRSPEMARMMREHMGR